jgi:lysozyme
MITESLINQIKYDEGVVLEVYKDHLGYDTCGVGHLLVKGNPEYGCAVGTPISESACDNYLKQDLQIAWDECKILYQPWFKDFPQEVKEILINMMFNMGRPRLTKFVNFNKAIMRKDWKSAAVEGRDSLWHKQVRKRAERLMVRLESL